MKTDGTFLFFYFFVMFASQTFKQKNVIQFYLYLTVVTEKIGLLQKFNNFLLDQLTIVIIRHLGRQEKWYKIVVTLHKMLAHFW